MRKQRQTMKESIQRVCNESESAAGILKPYNRQATGRPSISKDQHDLLSVIGNIVQASMVTDDCRRKYCTLEKRFTICMLN